MWFKRLFWTATLAIATVAGSAGSAIAVGRMYWADAQAHKIYRANLDGTNVEELVTTGFFDGPRGIALDVGTGAMYYSEPEPSSNFIKRSALNGSNPQTIVPPASGTSPNLLAVDPAGGKIYWTQYGSSPRVRRANLDGSGVQDLVTGLGFATGIALDVPGGFVYFVDSVNDKIRRCTLSGGSPTDIVTTGLTDPQALALDVPFGVMYWVDVNVGLRKARLDGTGISTVVPASGGYQMLGVAVDPTTHNIYWTERLGSFGPGRVRRVDPNGLNLVTLVDPVGVGGFCIQIDPTAVDDVVGPPTVTTCISTVNPCTTLPVSILRTNSTDIRAYSVTFSLSPELALCGGPGSITEGTYLSSVGGTTLQVLDNGGGSYTVDCAILGSPCGATEIAGTLFSVPLASSGIDGIGTFTVTGVVVRDCLNGSLPAGSTAPRSITADMTAPAAVTDLAATQFKAGNPPGGTTYIQVAFSPPSGAIALEVYRAGFGAYPEYDDAGNSPPAAPSYPPGPPWELTSLGFESNFDYVTTRDTWYYAMFSKDGCGNVSAVSNLTAGTLNYHLGDVSNGITACQGNNAVDLADISLLGAHYGAQLVPSDPFACLDVGPTTDHSVDGRPTTDDRVEFEDLIMFAINYEQVSKDRAPQRAAARDEFKVLLPGSVDPGTPLVARLWAQGSGRIQGLSTRLAWDPSILEYLGMESGDLLRAQDGVALSPRPGVVDVALLGVREQGLAGEGSLAEIRFRVLRTGDPGLRLEVVEARDAANGPIDVQLDPPGVGPEGGLPHTTQLMPGKPNPFGPMTHLAFALATPGRVELEIFTVDGRRVRTLVRSERPAGLHEVVWDGRDDTGHRLASGVYRARLMTAEGIQIRPLVMLK